MEQPTRRTFIARPPVRLLGTTGLLSTICDLRKVNAANHGRGLQSTRLSLPLARQRCQQCLDP